ncbi:signal recognition particle-docking protein FtsY [Candidatus Woesearchaeota archaeon]|nr:signal recognition particle-docking protein FtsY [Candidatus Woesearchaeota archaeon]
MFGFLKKKLKGALDKFTKKVEEEAPEEEVEVKKEVEVKPEEVTVKEELKAEEKPAEEVKEEAKEEVKAEEEVKEEEPEEKVEKVKEEVPEKKAEVVEEVKEEKKQCVKICPKCGSIDVEIEKDNAAKVRYGAPLNCVCKSCGFRSAVFPEVEERKIEEFRKGIKKVEEEIPEIIEEKKPEEKKEETPAEEILKIYEEVKEEPEASKVEEKPKEVKPKPEVKVEKPEEVPKPKPEIKPKPVEKPVEEAPKDEKKGFFRRITEKITTKRISESQFDDLFWDLELAMLENNVAVEVIEKIKADLKKDLTEKPVPRAKIEETVIHSLKNSVSGLFDVEQVDLFAKLKEKKPLVICFVGINGSGKTTSIAKVANMFLKNKASVVLAAADTFRAAAIDQLQLHADNLGVKLIKHDYGADAAAVAFDAVKHAEAKDRDVVLIDTAGRLHSDHNLVEEMKKIVRVSKPDLVLFVGESITGNDCTEQAQKFDEAVGVDGIILSKADVDEKGGAAISVSYVTKKPILYMGVGQEYDDLEPFDRDKILDSLFS